MTFHSTETADSSTETALATTDPSAGVTSAPASPLVHATAQDAYAAATATLQKMGQMSGIGANRLERLVEAQMHLTQALFLETRRGNDLLAAHIEALTAHTQAESGPSGAATS